MKLAELAKRFGLALHGDGEREIYGVASLARAGPTDLAFLANPLYRRQLAGTRAGAVILAAEDLPHCSTAALVSANPYADFARIAALFVPPPPTTAGIHPSAVIEEGAEIAPDASIGPLCHVAAGARVGPRSILGPGCVIGPDCTIGADCRLVARVTLVERVHLGDRVLIHPGAVIGADGFGLAMDRGRWLKVPQLAGVRIGDDCEIGANTTIDRGALEDTVLEEDVRLDNLIQIGHGVQIGAHTAMAGATAVAGSAKIGRYCLIGGGVGIVGHIEICDRVTITARSLVTHSIRHPGEYSSGVPLQENRQWRRNAARFAQLDRLARRLLALLKERNHD